VAVDSIVVIKVLDLVCNLCRSICRPIITWRALSIDTPIMNESLEHRIGAEFVELAQSAEHRQLLVCHALELHVSTLPYHLLSFDSKGVL